MAFLGFDTSLFCPSFLFFAYKFAYVADNAFRDWLGSCWILETASHVSLTILAWTLGFMHQSFTFLFFPFLAVGQSGKLFNYFLIKSPLTVKREQFV
jgi:hypothetical protein